ncbi:Methyltransferase domain-containing protein [Desulfurella multipotens]|uniref:Methyltransferase domain-containing protein n=2 Tax=Desulfurella multipotens TaxID=79269 RepID=A0A1G6QX24_9BACT|nr:methyltransferase domain-containing protein [Desulfurella multipotens]AHF96473.1 methyltransferase type 11 [Desulfurella acetivorans A63]SDC96307.1 Methyltransferase domain-containing protein [Desulfurella multipotens]
MSIKLNLGCGDKKLDGFVNVDFVEAVNPDVVWDLEKVPWPFEDSSVDEILLNHVLEHLGQQTSVYLSIIKEIWRICINGAIIHIRVPHPRHDNFLTDPTHVRPITVEGLQMFDQELNKQWIANKWANTPLGIYLGVNFKILSYNYILDPIYIDKLNKGEIKQQDLPFLMRTNNNVCSQINIEWLCVK